MSSRKTVCFLLVCCLTLALCQFLLVAGRNGRQIGADSQNATSEPAGHSAEFNEDGNTPEISDGEMTPVRLTAFQLARLRREIFELSRQCDEAEAKLQYLELFSEMDDGLSISFLLTDEQEIKKKRLQDKEWLHESTRILEDDISHNNFSALNDEEYGKLLNYCELRHQLDAILWDNSVPNQEKVELVRRIYENLEECVSLVKRQMDADDVFSPGVVYFCVSPGLGEERTVNASIKLDGQRVRFCIHGRLPYF